MKAKYCEGQIVYLLGFIDGYACCFRTTTEYISAGHFLDIKRGSCAIILVPASFMTNYRYKVLCGNFILWCDEQWLKLASELESINKQ